MDNSLLRKIMKDIRVELTEEFDLNFERKAFFDRKWTPLSPNYQPTTGSMLIRTGALRPWTQEPYRWNTAHLQQQCALCRHP